MKTSRSAPFLVPPAIPPLQAHEADDPWRFDALGSVRSRDAITLEALPRPRYRSALELGSALGGLTVKLQERCDALLSVGVALRDQSRALHRCRHLPHVRFQVMAVPDAFPEPTFDLTVVSERACHWSLPELERAQQHILGHLETGGHLLLVHWTGQTRDMRLSGNDVHDSFRRLSPKGLRHLRGEMDGTWRLDVFERL
ncbi:methyltransferase domain-containing protein [Corallococcus sp. ZKHCc1 1396]|uniref:Methyltransferase domain-containing protein n=1 Tax=Corallococcus soli TaxID=2710757 RepID=A0ABR9PQH5_9BACT|nr:MULTISPECIES: class I SAM-dependent methyltransferase [Corallococcus]MBE4750177.1 methyltransferase domain-containing protein [Corallococcus soli]MCY1036917.1 class I SAM-dependent methyltransferase [Corallococcus sp. BB11-1]